MAYHYQLDELIIHLIRNNKISEQSDLKELLQSHGYEIPQATISRHLKKLNVIKISGAYKIMDSLTNTQNIVSIKISHFGMIIIKTLPGNANSVAYTLDNEFLIKENNSEKDAGLLGSIAGDDTILLIAKDKESINKTLNVIERLFPHTAKIIMDLDNPFKTDK